MPFILLCSITFIFTISLNADMRFRFSHKIVSPFWRWALFLIGIPILELFLLHTALGMIPTLLCMFVSGLTGVFIAQREGLHCWRELHRQLDHGQVPTSPTIHGVLILTAAFLMILPGLLSSLLGFSLFFRLPRTLIASYMEVHFNAYRLQSQRKNDSPEDTIDV